MMIMIPTPTEDGTGGEEDGDAKERRIEMDFFSDPTQSFSSSLFQKSAPNKSRIEMRRRTRE